ncbi:unnamed protein product [Staurois parvus]|uniref:Uncharacterized protein n=1 Tax=Staurois parvus TaxID=386267 RepID=A0ABN9FUL3_9NEOB|nr:unnamed protein product [Staurois parvus]
MIGTRTEVLSDDRCFTVSGGHIEHRIRSAQALLPWGNSQGVFWEEAI